MNTLKTLKYGSRGPQTELLQLALGRAGYGLATDGIFGAATSAAVTSFQRKLGLAADGIVGQRTWQALKPYLTGAARHTIVRGDTLYDLALRYGSTIGAIETANPGIDPLALAVGRVINVPLPFAVVPTTISFTSTVLELCILGLRARYPFLRFGTAGKSVMGKGLAYIIAGEGQKQVFINASHHANEWITSTLVMSFVERYAAAWARGGEIFGQKARDLFAGATLFVMPMVNPDGVDLVTGELVSGRYYEGAKKIAEAYPDIPFPNGWKANINGVDPNLQYPAGWEEARKIKFAQGYISPAPRDYVGPAPLTAPESRAAYDFTRARDFALTLSYHTQGEVIFWKYLDITPPGAYELAQRFSEVSGYSVETTPTASGYAGYKDWFIDAYYRPGYTIEAGLGISPLPLSQFEKIYSDNEGIFITAIV